MENGADGESGEWGRWGSGDWGRWGEVERGRRGRLEVKTRRDAARKSIILPLEKNSESFLDGSNGSQATHSRSYSDYS